MVRSPIVASCSDIRSQYPISVLRFGGRSFEILPVMNEMPSFDSVLFVRQIHAEEGEN